MPSPYVPRLEVLRDYAAPSLPPGRPLAEAALELMHRIHADFAYDSDSTEIDTPLAQVLEQRRGVCQDFAHLMAGALRMWGLPARYVSGYLLTQAPEGGAADAGRRRLARLGAGLVPGHAGRAGGGPVPAGWTWTRPTTSCPAPATCAWRWGATMAT